MNTGPIWHGTSEQALQLADAVAHNCTCEFGNLGVRIATCAAHAMMEDQRTLDALAFGRYMADRFVAQEFDSDVLNALGPTQSA